MKKLLAVLMAMLFIATFETTLFKRSKGETLQEWNIEVVDSEGDVGLYSSLVVNENGWQFCSYYDATEGNLKYAWWDGEKWHIEVVDSAGNVGLYTSLAMDSNGNPHISYYDATNKDLKYAWWDPLEETWIIETIDSEGDVGWSSSLAIDSENIPHISYYDYTNNKLKYATFIDGEWHTEVVDDGGLYTSIGIKSDGIPCIAYTGENGGLKYAEFVGEIWINITVDNEAEGWDVSLAIDYIDRVHISYYGNGYLKYALQIEFEFSIENVDYITYGGWGSSIDTYEGFPFISYYDYTNKDLKYAKRSGEEWLKETVDSEGDVGQHSSLYLKDTYAHITYYDATNGDLKKAVEELETNNPPYPPEEPCPGEEAKLVDIENINLSWRCFDPDYDELNYKILFEAWDNTPDVNISWQKDTIYTLEELEPLTHYYWQVIAYDNKGGVTASPVWDFWTKDIEPPEAYIITPKENHLYIYGRDIGFIGKTLIIGPITVEVYANDAVGIYAVEFYVNNDLKNIDFYEPYTWRWSGFGVYNLSVKVIDAQHNILSIIQPGGVIVDLIPPLPTVTLFPADGQRGITGDMVPSSKGENGLKHYVSPVKGYNPPNDPDNVEIEAKIENNRIGAKLKWIVPANVKIIGNKALIPRNNPSKYVIKAQLVLGGVVISEDTMVVWIVRADISAKNVRIAEKSPPRTRGNIDFEATIQPPEIITDADRPALNGPNGVAPPNVPAGNPNVWRNWDNLAGGANHKWDISRQLRQKVIDPNNLYDPDGAGPKQPLLRHRSYENWPPSGIIGNDDGWATEEDNDPYDNKPRRGVITGYDAPCDRPPNRGNVGDKVEIRCHFREFVRLEIGGKWYRISDYFKWRLHFIYTRKVAGWKDDSIIELNHKGW